MVEGVGRVVGLEFHILVDATAKMGAPNVGD